MISAKKRFEILKRDGFRCQYCGRNGKDVTLEVDHVLPKSRGGTDDSSNLITCCRECNMGKGKTRLDSSELWKSKMEDLVVKIKKDFNKKWNGARLGEMSKDTFILLCTYIDLGVKRQSSPNSFDAWDYVYCCKEYDFAQPYTYRNPGGNSYGDSLQAEFKKGGDFCDYCCGWSYNEIMSLIDWFLDIVCNDEMWTGGNKVSDDGEADYRINYLLTRDLIQQWTSMRELEDDVCSYNYSSLYFLAKKHSYVKDRIQGFINGED